jgi:NADPH2:quinone reductase
VKAVVLGSEPLEPALESADWSNPVAAPDWVTVKVAAAGLNRNDAMSLAGRMSRSARSVIGSDGAGVVTDIGGGVDGW